MSLFKILMDATNTAFAISKVIVGTVLDASINSMAVFIAKDDNGEAAFIQLNPDGTLPVSNDPGTTLRESQELLAGAQTKNIETEVVNITLTAEKTYTKQSAMVSCFRASKFRMVYVDDFGVTDIEQDLGFAFVDAGDVNEQIALTVDRFTTIGGTGVQKLIIFHTPLDKTSDALASVSVNEVA